MYKDTNNGEQAKAKRIIRKALDMGLLVSVEDGDGGWTCKRSTDYTTILDAIGEMDMDQLLFRNADGSRAGGMLLVWGNDPSGCELAADYTANPSMEALAAA